MMTTGPAQHTPAPAPAPDAMPAPAPALQVNYRPGMRVRITSQMPRLTGNLVNSVEGTVVRFGQQKTGSWYAHSKDHRLWLDRLELRKEDGEMVVVNLDQYSHVEILGG